MEITDAANYPYTNKQLSDKGGYAVISSGAFFQAYAEFLALSPLQKLGYTSNSSSLKNLECDRHRYHGINHMEGNALDSIDVDSELSDTVAQFAQASAAYWLHLLNSLPLIINSQHNCSNNKRLMNCYSNN